MVTAQAEAAVGQAKAARAIVHAEAAVGRWWEQAKTRRLSGGVGGGEGGVGEDASMAGGHGHTGGR